jgi:hypothetical protein
MTFVHPLLLWGLALAALPVLIHLINMLRHRRVEWAAMEFLLASQKKNRTWIVFKQLLLLLLRMLAIAAVVLVVARPLLRNQFGALFGQTQTHHIVLLDDSFSMSDSWEGTDAFDRGKMVIRQIAAEAARQTQPQSCTLIRFSRAAPTERGTRHDLLEQPVNSEFAGRLEKLLGEMKVSQTAAGPGDALERIRQLLESSGDREIVYLVSDFRARQWDDPTDLKNQLLAVNAAGAELHLVNCVDDAHPNLAVASLVPQEGIRAAGVPWFMDVTVRNFGTGAVRDVAVLLEEDGQSRPALTIEEIPGGRAVTKRFEVQFPGDGQHQVKTQLETDAVAVDNSRWATFDLPADIPVLIVDGDPAARGARYLGVASSPGGPVRTGLNPRIETPRFLSLQVLDGFRAVNLVNIERLDRSAIEALERYATSGGGVALFLGDKSQSRFINDELYRNGEGLFPLPLAGPKELVVDRLDKAPDLAVDDHFIFRVFANKRNNFLDAVAVERYFAAPDGWAPAPDSGVRVLARLRNGAPLAVERALGAGRVVAFLTSAEPTWNNWTRNPSFVVLIQDLQAYLARRPADKVSQPVGSPLEFQLDPTAYQAQVRFRTPQDATPTATIDGAPGPGGALAFSFAETDASGVYQALLTQVNGTEATRRFAVNVDTDEGDLATLGGRDLATRLARVRYEYRRAADFQYEVGEMAGYDMSTWLLYLLVGLLVVEQIVAWWASYHPPARRAVAAEGGAT